MSAVSSPPANDAPMVEWALAYASRGLHVLPLQEVDAAGNCSCTGFKPGCAHKPGKHPRSEHGANDAARDEATIRAWWTTWPTANIGIHARKSDLMVLDVDVPPDHEDGRPAVAAAEAEYGPLPRGPRARSGSGGVHVLMKSMRVRLKQKPLGDGSELLDNGYFVAPPSRHKSGGRYEWIVSPWQAFPELPSTKWLPFLRKGGPRAKALPAPAAHRDLIERAVAALAPAYRIDGQRRNLTLAFAKTLLTARVSEADAKEVAERLREAVGGRSHEHEIATTYEAGAAAAASWAWVEDFPEGEDAIRELRRALNAENAGGAAGAPAGGQARSAGAATTKNRSRPERPPAPPTAIEGLVPGSSERFCLIYAPGREPRFLVADPATGQHEERDAIALPPGKDGKPRGLLPHSDDLLRKGVLFAPSAWQDPGDPAALLADVRAFIGRWVELDDRDVRLCAAVVLATYFFDRCPAFPIVVFRGPPDTGKSRAAHVAGSIAKHGWRTSGTSSFAALFLPLDLWKPTMIVQEGDLNSKAIEPERESMTKFWNERVDRDGNVPRGDYDNQTVRIYRVFGPTFVSMRHAFPDDATETRAIVLYPPRRTRRDPAKDDYMMLNLPPEFDEDAQHLRNRLWAFRLLNLDRFQFDYRKEFGQVQTRVAQMLQAVWSVACLLDDDDLKREIEALARDLSAARTETLATSYEGAVVRAFVEAAARFTAKDERVYLVATAQGVRDALIADRMQEDGSSEGSNEETLARARGRARDSTPHARSIAKRLSDLGFEQLKGTRTGARAPPWAATVRLLESLVADYFPEEEQERALAKIHQTVVSEVGSS